MLFYHFNLMLFQSRYKNSAVMHSSPWILRLINCSIQGFERDLQECERLGLDDLAQRVKQCSGAFHDLRDYFYPNEPAPK